LLGVLIIGCGKIAGGFDFARTSPTELPLTHAGAYSRDGRFELAGCVEPDDERRTEFMSRWGIRKGFRTIEETKTSGTKFDVISICSPTNSHAGDLAAAAALRPKLIFCEKPVTGSAGQTAVAVRRCKEGGVLLAVNYTRRWDPAIADLRQGIHEGRWGELRSIVACYNKGLLNNGSHLLDLLLLLFGSLGVKAVGTPVEDYSPQDPTVPIWLESSTGVPILVACGNAADFAFFEMQLVFSLAVLTMEESGLAWRTRQPVESTMFGGYRVLGAGTRSAGGYTQAMRNAVGNIFDAISNGAPLASTGESALAAQRLCEEIRQP
jgi:predicted dehydrogenase